LCRPQFCDTIRSYPLQPQPEIFGLHVNADITCQQAETYELLATVLGLQPRTTSSGTAADSQDATVARMANSILEKVCSTHWRLAGLAKGCAAASSTRRPAGALLTGVSMFPCHCASMFRAYCDTQLTAVLLMPAPLCRAAAAPV
jgi:hypothetical protein